ncbi:GNAT family N-acetyltransferase [Streptomyces sp. A1-5]|uniref:GNAT family N-acetyltransferase n=1 Tax=Streptomyces sp. A1-5 TaxID=2738410 RepID=UPI001F251938|nr:GNAT family N-acetyltransferase [Streptomyces sp. A1-5]UJB40889.1 GNAT family N-acetyltransferase [Streptomyces sp. A1-5]
MPEPTPALPAGYQGRPATADDVPESDTLLVHDGVGRLAARARVNRRSEVDVHPVHRGRGLGAALLDWAEARARRAGSEGIVQTVPGDDAHAVALLRSRGYAPLVTAWLPEFAGGPAPRGPTRTPARSPCTCGWA